jgi:nitrogen fixation-related uncharacterized protein
MVHPADNEDMTLIIFLIAIVALCIAAGFWGVDSRPHDEPRHRHNF